MRSVSRWITTRQATVDRLVALLGLIPALVVAVPVALLIAVIDRQVPLIRLTRVGRGGTTFRLVKFRTMRNPDDSSAVTGSNDQRVTPLGRVLRRYRLDELPQILNVAAGQMAILGARPEDPVFVDLDQAGWQLVLAARPGIGGPTQLFASRWEAHLLDEADAVTTYREAVVPAKLAIDEWYLRNASPRLDAEVLAATAKELVLRRPAVKLRTRILHGVVDQGGGESIRSLEGELARRLTIAARP